MGLFDKIFHGTEGDQAPVAGLPAVITGIRGREDDTTEMVFRVEWTDGEEHARAIRFGSTAAASLRLGSEVLVRTDGSGVVLDVDAMRAAPAAPTASGQRKRSVPEPGMDDKAQDSRSLSRVKKWRPERGTVTSWERVYVFGMPADNWHVVVTRADGTSGVCSRAHPHVPRWFVHPGSEVPITVDPGDATRVQIDWATLAGERAGGRWDDVPPEGSVAAALVGRREDGT